MNVFEAIELLRTARSARAALDAGEDATVEWLTLMSKEWVKTQPYASTAFAVCAATGQDCDAKYMQIAKPLVYQMLNATGAINAVRAILIAWRAMPLEARIAAMQAVNIVDAAEKTVDAMFHGDVVKAGYELYRLTVTQIQMAYDLAQAGYKRLEQMGTWVYEGMVWLKDVGTNSFVFKLGEKGAELAIDVAAKLYHWVSVQTVAMMQPTVDAVEAMLKTGIDGHKAVLYVIDLGAKSAEVLINFAKDVTTALATGGASVAMGVVNTAVGTVSSTVSDFVDSINPF